MTKRRVTWAGFIRAPEAATLRMIHATPGMEVCEVDDQIWVRGRAAEATVHQELQMIPWETFYDVLSDHRLRPKNSLTANGRLPNGPWHSLQEWLHPELELPEEEEMVHCPHDGFRLIARSEPATATLLLADAKSWLRHIESLSDGVLKGAEFCVISDKVLIRGETLPPLDGARFAEIERCILPVDRMWDPPVPPGDLRNALRVSGPELLFFHGDGTFSKIPASAWLSATFTAVMNCGLRIAEGGKTVS